MKKASQKEKEQQRARVLEACERTRQACNKLSEEEMRRLQEKALAIIYGQDAKVPAGGR